MHVTKTHLFFVLFLSVVLPFQANAGISDVFCDDGKRLKDRLKMTYGAEIQGRGLRGPDAVMEIWIIPHTGEWTMVQSYANGRSCIVAIGEGWQNIAPVVDPA